MKQFCKSLANNHIFELFIIGIILVNSILIGVETSVTNNAIKLTQQIILYIFTFEILVRFIAADSIKKFFSDGWNVFDFTLVVIGYIPETMFANASMVMALRVLRVFRILRLLRTAKEVKLIVAVLIKSMTSMFYNLILFLIFVYLYAIVGVSMFRLPDPATLNPEQKAKYEQLMEVAPHSPSNSPDPYGNIGEAIFTLFRSLTGEDWTDLRYNSITASEMGLIQVNSAVITTYHVSWFCIAAFLLLNLVTGAVINNYQVAIDEQKEEKEKEKKEAEAKE
ncbi:MAG: ion transporter [Muribaculaceae bacterium]|nr:ion transporter [Muribaculaceae bacterium]